MLQELLGGTAQPVPQLLLPSLLLRGRTPPRARLWPAAVPRLGQCRHCQGESNQPGKHTTEP